MSELRVSFPVVIFLLVHSQLVQEQVGALLMAPTLLGVPATEEPLQLAPEPNQGAPESTAELRQLSWCNLLEE